MFDAIPLWTILLAIAVLAVVPLVGFGGARCSSAKNRSGAAKTWQTRVLAERDDTTINLRAA